MTLKRMLGEFLGTFVIVFVPVLASATGGNLANAAVVSGLAVLAMVYTFGPISGAHFNPAVTAAFWAVGRFPAKEVPKFWAAQFLGGVAAAGLGTALFRPGLGVHIPTGTLPQNIAIEFFLTAILMVVIMGVATGPHEVRPIAGIAIGFTVTMNVLLGGMITGASMNPARTLGPALFGGAPAINALGLYLTVPFAGAVAGAWIYQALHPDLSPQES